MRSLRRGILLSLLLAVPTYAINFTTPILNHPDGSQSPPPYGLRLDDLFLQTPSSGSVVGGVGGSTSFSFDPADGSSMNMTVSMSGSDLEINIAGIAHGGADTGATYGFGEGDYSIDFTYTMNVQGVPGPTGGFIVSPNNFMNTGTITALAGNPDITAGTEWTLFDQIDDQSQAFVVLRDQHRLGGYPAISALDPLVGRGWVTFNSDGSNTGGTQDWLFIADTPIPEPTTIVLLAMGCGVVGLRRNRRS